MGEDLTPQPAARSRQPVVERVSAALCALAAIAVVVTLFRPWYAEVTGYLGTSFGGGFGFATPSGDAWSVVPGTAAMLLVASLVTVASAAVRAIRPSRLTAVLMLLGCVGALAVMLWRAADPASETVHHFTFTLFRAEAETEALIAAAVALLAASISLAWGRPIRSALRRSGATG